MDDFLNKCLYILIQLFLSKGNFPKTGMDDTGFVDTKVDLTALNLITLQRYANIDLNVQIDIDPGPLLPNQQGVSRQQYVIGKISYPNGQQGTLIYMKLAVTDNEPEYIRFYNRDTPAFPHESTADQFFNETKFEVYRALGEFAAQRTFADEKVRELVGEQI